MSVPEQVERLRRAIGVFEDVAKNVPASSPDERSERGTGSMRDLVAQAAGCLNRVAGLGGDEPAARSGDPAGYEGARDAALRILQGPLGLDTPASGGAGDAAQVEHVLDAAAAEIGDLAARLAEATGQNPRGDEEVPAHAR